jgi:hypothetical protein
MGISNSLPGSHLDHPFFLLAIYSQKDILKMKKRMPF